jgi:hypothetical protein
MSAANAIIILERTTFEPDDPSDPERVLSFMVHEWHVIAVQNTATKKTCECKSDHNKPLSDVRLCDACAVRYEIEASGPSVLWGDLEPPEGMTLTADKILVRGTMKWTPNGGYFDVDAGADAEFEIEEFRILKEFTQ